MSAAPVAAQMDDMTKTLHRAAKRGDVVEVRQLLEAGADATGRGESGQSVLFVAAAAGHVGIVAALAAAGRWAWLLKKATSMSSKCC